MRRFVCLLYSLPMPVPVLPYVGYADVYGQRRPGSEKHRGACSSLVRCAATLLRYLPLD